MTPAQIKHLRRIDAHLDALLKRAAERSPGEWFLDAYGNVMHSKTCSIHSVIEDVSIAKEDAAFIAACAGNAERGWRSTKDEIADLIIFDENIRGWKDDNGCAGAAIQRIQHRISNILKRWPLESLTLP